MTNRELLSENGYEDAIVFENPSFDKAIIGVTEDGRVVYDYDLMIEAAMEEEGWTEQASIDWIEYNTIRSLAYIDNGPVIIFKLIR